MFFTTGLGGSPAVFDVRNSLRFNDDDSAYLSRTPGTAGNRRTWTWSGWIKRSGLSGTNQTLFGRNQNGSGQNFAQLALDGTTGALIFTNYSTVTVNIKTSTHLLRDVSAWYHIVCVFDTNNATAADRIRLFLNGTRITSFSSSTDPPLDYEGYINETFTHTIGSILVNSQTNFFDGYMAEVHFLDGRAYDASYFGETDTITGIWKPKKPTFTAAEYGVNGFYLDFKDTSASTATALGGDKAPTGPVGHTALNNWTPVNLQMTSDAAFEFRSDGVSLGPQAGVNTNTNNYVLWNWKEDPVAGFDIVNYTGTGVDRTVAHNLGAVPKLMIVKRIDGADDWPVQHAALAATQVGIFNTTATFSTLSTFQSIYPTSSVFSVSGASGATNASGGNYIAYLWAEVPGYSRFASYTGNGSADGPFVWCGFRPRWLLIKRTDVSGGWMAFDSARSPLNAAAYPLLYPYLPDAEVAASSSYGADFLSNGFKIRTADTWHNASGGTYVFAAFAETPFKYGNAR